MSKPAYIPELLELEGKSPAEITDHVVHWALKGRSTEEMRDCARTLLHLGAQEGQKARVAEVLEETALVINLRVSNDLIKEERDDFARVVSVLMRLFKLVKGYADEPRDPGQDLLHMSELDYAVEEAGKQLGRFKDEDVSTWNNPFDDDVSDPYQPFQRDVVLCIERGSGTIKGTMWEWREARIMWESEEQIKEALGNAWDPMRFRLITYRTGYKLMKDGLGDG